MRSGYNNQIYYDSHNPLISSRSLYGAEHNLLKLLLIIDRNVRYIVSRIFSWLIVNRELSILWG
jgi:hypothetical protein